MNREQFWQIVAHGQEDEAPGELVRAALEKLPASEIAAYQQHFDALTDQAYRWDLWGAAYVIEGGCSDDGFTDFRYALISRGREVYEAALQNPDSLAAVDICSDELFGYVAGEVYEAKTGQAIALASNQAAEPLGEQWDFDDKKEIRRRLPQLAARLKIK